MTADDLTRLRADDLRETAGEFYPDDRFVAALIDRVERAERERDEWKDRMWVSVRERAVWSHEAGQHAGDIPFHHCPICEASFQRSELAALRAAVAGLADEWDDAARDFADQAEGMSGDRAARYHAVASKYEMHAQRVRALLTNSGGQHADS